MSTALTLLDWYACGCGKVVTYATNNLPAGWHENRCDVCISKEGPAPARVVLSAEQDVRAIAYHVEEITLDPVLDQPPPSDMSPDEYDAMFALWRSE
jgi:hypothetical protein